MEHMIEESLLMDELNYESSDMTKKSSLISGGSVGHLRRIRKLTPEEEDAYRQKLALKNQTMFKFDFFKYSKIKKNVCVRIIFFGKYQKFKSSKVQRRYF